MAPFRKVTNEQLESLTDLVKLNPRLNSGKLSGDYTRRRYINDWEEVAETLNNLQNGANKSGPQWRKYWQGIRNRTKAKNAKINKHRQKTGGGKRCKNLTELEESIMATINNTVIDGHNAEEAGFLDENNDDDYNEDVDEDLHETMDDECSEEWSDEYINNIPDNVQDNSVSGGVMNEGEIENGDNTNEYTNNLDSDYSAIMTDDEIDPESHVMVGEQESAASSLNIVSSKVVARKNQKAADVIANASEESVRVQEQYYKEKIRILEEQLRIKQDLASSAITGRLSCVII